MKETGIESIVFNSSVHDLHSHNSSFDSGVLRVCYHGKNRNGSYISKETFERCMDSIYNCPVVCNYDRETDSIGAHDMELVKKANGSMGIVNLTQPIGVVPESAKVWWEEIEDDSDTHEYLCVDILVWKRQEAYQKIKNSGITKESMEITINKGKRIDGVYHIEDFEFTAFCLLESANPCYESASIELFSCSDFKEQLQDMIQEMRDAFTTQQPSEEVVIEPQKDLEGGNETLEEKIALMQKFGYSVDSLDFTLEDFSLEELQDKFEALANSEQENFALTEQFLCELIRALSAEEVDTCFGAMSRYHYVDCDTALREVYCYDCEDWNLYGFAYAEDGDNVIVDFESKKRKKFVIADFDEGEQKNVFAPIFNLAAEKLTSATESLEAKTAEFNALNDEVTELQAFKADCDAKELNAKYEQVFEQFADLADVEDYKSLLENHEGFTVEDLEEKCFAIRGRNGTTAKFSQNLAQPTARRLPVQQKEQGANINEPYGGIFAKYGIEEQ